MEGFIKTHRRIMESQIWEKPSDWYKIWNYLLMSARYKDDRDDIPLGSHLTTYKNIEVYCHVSYDTVYNAMQWFKVQGMVQVQKRNRKVLIQLKNWEKYNGGTGTETMKVQNKYEISTDTIIEEGKKVRKKEIISKDITTEVDEPEYGNKEVNEMLGFLCKAIGVDQFKESQKYQRFYVKHFINFANKNGKQDFIERLKSITGDPFKLKNCNSLKYLYGEIKSYIHTPLQDNGIKKC